MKLELKNNKVFFESKGLKKEIHPFWLRERVNGCLLYTSDAADE